MRCPKIGESLPAAARPTLAMLHPDLMSRLAEDTAEGRHNICTGTVSAWASSDLDETYAITNMYGAGWHLDRIRFEAMLRNACGPSVIRNGRFLGVRRFDHQECEGDLEWGWEVSVEPNAAAGHIETFRARWIVDATGRSASVARKV